MHTSSFTRMRWFIQSYQTYFFETTGSGQRVRILDIGGGNVNGSYRDLCDEETYKYEALDIAPSEGVDIVPEHAYEWREIPDHTYDVVISGSTFEHIEYIWLTIKEIERVLKPGGLCCLLAPNGLGEHRYPYDCWRFYSDGMRALAKWSGMQALHASVAGIPDDRAGEEWDDPWNDAMLIAQKAGGARIENAPQLAVERRISYDFRPHYDCLAKWLDLQLSGINISRYFLEKEIHSLAVYGAGIVGRLIAKELKGTECSARYFIDKYNKEKQAWGLRCYSLEEDIPLGDIEAVVISPLRRIELSGLYEILHKKIPVLFITDIIEELCKEYD